MQEVVETTKAFVVKSFRCCLTDNGITSTYLKEGTVVDIPSNLVSGLEKEGFISIGDDVPTVQEEIKEETNNETKLTAEYILSADVEELIETLMNEKGIPSDMCDDMDEDEIREFALGYLEEDENDSDEEE